MERDGQIRALTREEEFAQFARERQRQLLRTAFLLCGDWHRAQDLTQSALLNLCRAWNKARRADQIDAYAHRVLVNAFLSEQRKLGRERTLRASLPPDPEAGFHGGALSGDTELRLTLLALLDQLPPKSRAVVVLRFWEDLSVEETARLLDCSAGTVKSQSSRALARLRVLLADTPVESHCG
jgi:RNA polymerase sigma-70 factor (sigma-E family)